MAALQWILYGLGMFIIGGSHIYILAKGLPQSMMIGHAILNLIAFALIIVSTIIGMKDSVKD